MPTATIESPETAPKSPEKTSGSLGEQQVTLAEAWSQILEENGVGQTGSRAEIAMRNPMAYANTTQLDKLPGDLPTLWDKVQKHSNELAKSIAIVSINWTDKTGLEKIYRLVLSGNIQPEQLGEAGDVMRASSELFAKSIQYEPGDTEHYENNIKTAQTWLTVEKKSIKAVGQ